MNTNVKNKILGIIFATILILTLFNINVYAETSTFELTDKSMDLELNRTRYLSYTGGSGDITWESSEPTIASVDNEGHVEGKKIGKAVITATRGGETSSCTVNVIYSSLNIKANSGSLVVSSVNLVMGEHETEKLKAEARDWDSNVISNPETTWVSSNTSVVTVNKTTGELKAIKPGKATITATVAGQEDTCDVEVFSAPVFTDFSKAKYKTALNWTVESLQITGIKPDTGLSSHYYYMITKDNKKPSITTTKYGAVDTEKMKNKIEYLSVNKDYLFTNNFSKYAELNQDLYLWVIQDESLAHYYTDSNGNTVSYATKFVVNGEKINRAKLPQLNLILQTMSLWGGNKKDNQYTYITFNFPTDTKNRKFKLKIGKVTDNSILTKIQKNNYTGITELLQYAKKHDAVYSKDLTTTSLAYFRSDNALFDGRKLLEDDAYYYIYAQFDDEDGKYYPIEGVTLAQAWLAESSNAWDLWAYTSSDFKWNNLTTTTTTTKKSTEKSNKKDTTVAKGVIPQTGVKPVIIGSIVFVVAIGAFFYIRYNKLRDIK